MYGLINQAIQDLVIQNYGKETWSLIKSDAHVKVPFFQALVNYDDQVTYDLIKSTSLILEMPQKEVLEAFGYFWITFTAQKGYEGFLFSGSASLRDFIMHLNELHEKIEDLFPHYTAPGFRYEDIQEKSLTLIYESRRSDLEYMLLGLLKGLGTKFKENIEIEFFPKNQDQLHAKFRLKF